MYGNKKTYREWFSLSIFDVNYIDQKLSGGIFEPHGYWKEMREIAVKLTEIFFNKEVVING